MKKLNFLLNSTIISTFLFTGLAAQAQNLNSINTVQQIYERREQSFTETSNETRKRIIESNLKTIEINEINRDNENSISYEIDELKLDNHERFKSFVLAQNPKIKENLAESIVKNVNKYSQENDLDPKIVLALMAKESSFRTSVVSTSGAIGLGQLKRGTALEVGVKNPFNAVENIKGTTRYLSKLYKTFKGDINKTLASYYMGPGALKRTLEAGRKLPPQVKKYVSKIKNFHSMI